MEERHSKQATESGAVSYSLQDPIILYTKGVILPGLEKRSRPYEQLAPPSSQQCRPAHLSTLSVPPVCTCQDPTNAAHGLVICANFQECRVKTYHKKCVGLANRPEAPGWRCFSCRPRPGMTRTAQVTHVGCASSSPARISQQVSGPRPRTPPLEPTPLVPTGPAEPPLHPEQEQVVCCIENGSNVFYTGSADTGKSTVLKAFVRRWKKLGKQVDIVAPSGIAALNVDGMTIFSYAYWHPDTFKKPLREILDQAHNRSTRKRLNKTDVLVIDEISMVERNLLVRLDAAMREVRGAGYGKDDPNRDLHS